jgi:hypothetical protein
MILYFHELLRIKLKDQHKASTPINNQKHRPNNWNNKDQTLGNIKGGKGAHASSCAQDNTLLFFPNKFMIALVAQDSFTHTTC